MRHYETIYIINPNLADEDYGEVIKKYNDLLAKQKAVIIKVEEWGKQRMAYVVKKFDKGSFMLINYCGEADNTAEFERALKLDDRVLLFQTIKLADDVDPEELLAKEKKTSEEATVEEEVGPTNGAATETEERKQTGEVSHGVSAEG